MWNNFSIVPLHYNKTIMLSITCFREYFNLSYTRRPCLDAKSLLCATKKTYMAIGQHKINSILSTTGN